MSSPSNVPGPDVLILRQGQLDANIAQRFGAQLLAEITHLPAGVTSSYLESVTVPPGGKFTECVAGSDPALVHVVAGQVMASWGSGSRHSATAGPGDALLLPAGMPLEVLNINSVETVRLILVRGS